MHIITDKTNKEKPHGHDVRKPAGEALTATTPRKSQTSLEEMDAILF